MATQVPVKGKGETSPTERTRPGRLLEEMEEWANRVMPWRPFREALFFGGALPQVDIINRDKEVLVRATVAGFDKDDIEVTTTQDAVTLCGTHRSERKDEAGEYYAREIRSEDFMRTVTLPARVDDAKAQASFRDGLLEVVLPKIEVEKHTLKIETH